MKYFYTTKISGRTWRIEDLASTKMYLIEGDHTAALIDTGSGVGDLYSHIRSLTSKPLIIILTHGHLDHAMGTGSFPPDIPIYLHPADETLYRNDSVLSRRQQYVKSQQILRGLKQFSYKPREDNWYSVRDFESLLPLHIGQLFDLGGERLRICPGEGHTRGCVTILLEEERSLLLGDAVNGSIFLFDKDCLSVKDFKTTLLQLKKDTQGCYDRTYLCHGSGDGENNLIDGAIYICDKILAKQDDHFPQKRMGQKCYSAKKISFPYRFHDIGDHSSANILYKITEY